MRLMVWIDAAHAWIQDFHCFLCFFPCFPVKFAEFRQTQQLRPLLLNLQGGSQTILNFRKNAETKRDVGPFFLALFLSFSFVFQRSSSNFDDIKG